MSTSISARAASAREQARETDGTFGEQEFARATGVDLDNAGWGDLTPEIDEEEIDRRRRTLVIPTSLAEEAEHRIAKANRRLEREGLEDRFELTREDDVSFRRPTPEEINRYGLDPREAVKDEKTTIVLNRPSIGQEGWRFGATLERIPDSDDFTMRTARGEEFGGITPEPGRCDHCGQFRARNTTYLVRHEENGEVLQVGSSCLESFLGVKPKGLWSLGWELDASGEDDWESMGWSGPDPVRDNRTLIARALAVSEGGAKFVSRSRAQDWDKVSTTDHMANVFARLGPSASATARREQEEMLTRADEYEQDGTVGAVLESAGKIDPDSDYGRNMHLLLKHGYASERMESTLVSAVGAYRRKLRGMERQKAQQERIDTVASGFIGEVKERTRDVPVTITNVFETTRTAYAYPYNEEPFQIITMRTGDGHELVWKTGSVQEVKVGDEAAFTGTVKKHSQYRGADQTEMRRGKFTIERREDP